jgi:hypothetical protein
MGALAEQPTINGRRAKRDKLRRFIADGFITNYRIATLRAIRGSSGVMLRRIEEFSPPP